MPTTTLYLTRHAEQEDLGDGDAPEAGLTAHGVEQAHRLGNRLATLPGGDRPQVIRHGSLPRAARTAVLLAEHLGVPYTPDDRLADRTPVPAGDDVAAVPQRWHAFLAAVPPDERDEGARHLTRAAGELLTPADDDRAELLVTHTFVIGWLVRHVLDAPSWRWIGLNHAHCGLTTITVREDRPPLLLGYNDVGHLL